MLGRKTDSRSHTMAELYYTIALFSCNMVDVGPLTRSSPEMVEVELYRCFLLDFHDVIRLYVMLSYLSLPMLR